MVCKTDSEVTKVEQTKREAGVMNVMRYVMRVPTFFQHFFFLI